MINYPIYSILILFLGAFLTAMTGERFNNLRKIIVLVVTTASFIFTLILFKEIMIEKKIISYWMGNWAPISDYSIGIGLEVDSLSLFFGIIVSFLVFLSGFYSFKYMSKDNGLDKYYSIFLLLSGSIMGLVFTGDLFNMYVMIEIMTFAAVGLTAFRNEKAISIEAAFKYIVIGSLGSSLILLATALIYEELHTLNLAQISAQFLSYSKSGQYPVVLWFALALMMAGYAVKAFLVPCHIVAPDAYMAAPTSISMLFSGIVNKAGVYGILRLLFVTFQSMGLPKMQFLIVFWGTITMFIGVTMALYQNDFKRLLAFHSISQVGYIMVGVGLYTELGVTGGIYHVLNHSLFKGLLFLCAGAVLYSTGTTDLNKLGGLAKKMPYTTGLFLIGAFSISGIPPFNGFVSKWLIYQATFEKAIKGNNIGFAFVTIIGLVVSVMTLASFIKVTQSAFFGQLPREYNNIEEVPLSMRIPMTLLGTSCLIAGVFPQLINKYLVQPAVISVFNAGKYINVMMGEGYAEKISNKTVEAIDINYSVAGYSPLSWLTLLLILLAAFAIFTLTEGFISLSRRRNSSEYIAATTEETENRAFYCGEIPQYSHMGGRDLFWGFKHNFRYYFKLMANIHNGKINDYVLQVFVTTAFLIVYIFAIVVS